MSPRAGEPSTRVAEILDDRDPTVLELPPTVAMGRYSVSRQAIIGVALVVAVAVAVLAGRYYLARQDAAPQPVTEVAASGDRSAFSDTDTQGEVAETASDTEAGAESDAAADEGAAAGAPSAAPDVTVHVVGEVKSPGIVSLPGGSRVVDALEQAGGETPGADLTGINLARELVDGEQVVVPKPGETPVAAAPPVGGPGSPGGPAVQDAPVNLNTADLATLETLPGVGPVLAQRIMDWRLANGQFVAIEELGEVSGIGEKTYAQLAPKVTV